MGILFGYALMRSAKWLRIGMLQRHCFVCMAIFVAETTLEILENLETLAYF